MKQWQCIVCGFVYDETKGLPEDGIAPGTRWQDIPEDWACPECGIAKADFEMVVLAASVPPAPGCTFEKQTGQEGDSHGKDRYWYQ